MYLLGVARSTRAASLLAALLVLACGDGGPRPHLVLIVVDSLRADHLGSYGYERPTSPNIDRPVAASRFAKLGETHRAGMPWSRILLHRLASAIQNRVLGRRVRDPDSGYRAYATPALRAVPFQLDSPDRSFDTELAIQFRCLGLACHEVPTLPPWSEESSPREKVARSLRASATAVGYRLHQLHVIRHGRDFVARAPHRSRLRLRGDRRRDEHRAHERGLRHGQLDDQVARGKLFDESLAEPVEVLAGDA
ncbi:MAG: hypothetical protein QNK04_04040 [Myxococcota bacterium]|nr:hypothetical protein [Myxococcota bacterium]